MHCKYQFGSVATAGGSAGDSLLKSVNNYENVIAQLRKNNSMLRLLVVLFLKYFQSFNLSYLRSLQLK